VSTIISLNSDILMRLLPLHFFASSSVSITNYDELSGIMSSNALFQFCSVVLAAFVFERNEFGGLKSALTGIGSMSKADFEHLNWA
jgi:hypothetical protein